MRLLFLSTWFPYPPNNGSKIRIYNLLRALSKKHEVVLLSFAENGEVSEESRRALGSICQEIKVASKPVYRPTRAKALLGFFSSQPRSLVDRYSLEMEQLVRQTVEKGSIDAVITSQIDTVSYGLALAGVPRIFEEVELTVLYEPFANQPASLRKFRSGLTWWKLSNFIRSTLNAFDACTVVSEQEQTRVKEVAPGYRAIGVIPNGVDVRYNRGSFGAPEPDTLVYAGALTYGPNFDAVDFFVREVLPLIQAERPEVKLFVTGRTEGVPIGALRQNPAVHFTGYLDDIRPRIAQSWASIVPLRVGGGTRLKILESLALGTPVVSTAKGAEGLDLRPDREILVADDPAGLAAAILRLLQDRPLREKLSCAGRKVVETKYDWQIIGRNFSDFIEEVVLQTRYGLSKR